MFEVHERLGTHCHAPVAAKVVLTHDQRDRGRLKLISDTGEEVRVFLERGKPLLVGEYLKAVCGRHLQVEGAKEPVLEARCDDWNTFARACYHLGNRHVRIEVGDRLLRIKPDHVLEEMLNLLGLETGQHEAVFMPESGAYAHGQHHHDH
ncbi:MAG: urease accessory protein UreE [Oceanospirillales bacterium]|nr:urease accessory protein UreE [Oceanospirillales bacterium]